MTHFGYSSDNTIKASRNAAGKLLLNLAILGPLPQRRKPRIGVSCATLVLLDERDSFMLTESPRVRAINYV